MASPHRYSSAHSSYPAWSKPSWKYCCITSVSRALQSMRRGRTRFAPEASRVAELGVSDIQIEEEGH